MIAKQIIKPIETERLILRAMDENDAADVLAFAGDTETAYWAGIEPLRTIDEAREMIDFCNWIDGYCILRSASFSRNLGRCNKTDRSHEESSNQTGRAI